MRIAIRVDASLAIGTGHLQRCLSLADMLVAHGAAVHFVVRQHDEVADARLGSTAPTTWLAAPTNQDHEISSGDGPYAAWAGVSWSQDASETTDALHDFRPDWVLVDHYAFGSRWHHAVREALGCRLMAIDDLGDRALDVDILLDGNFAQDHVEKFRGRLMRPTRVLAGPRYAILSAVYRSAPRTRVHPEVRSIGIFMGGTDPDGASAKVIESLRSHQAFAGPIEVVSTSANPRLPQLRQTCANHSGVTLTLDLPNLAAFYARHDLQIGAGGTATHERCCIGAPTIALVLAENQLTVVPALAAIGAVRGARLSSLPVSALLPGAPELADVLRDLAANPASRIRMSQLSQTLVDGRGAERTALCLLGAEMQLRRATIEDGPRLHAWRNHPDVREVSATTDAIPLDSHMTWLKSKLAATDCRLYVASVGPSPVGSIRFDTLPDGRIEVSLYLDPNLSGLALGSHMLLTGERTLMKERQGDAVLTASVMPGNTASERLFIGCGYTGGPLHFEKHLRSAEV